MTKQLICQSNIFNGHTIRTIERDGELWFSVVDVIQSIKNPKDVHNYWSVTKKNLLKDEGGAELVKKIHLLKLQSSDGKFYETDCMIEQDIYELLYEIPSKKTRAFKQFSASLVKKEIAQSTEINYEHKFRKWHERLALNPDIPADYFCILHEAHVMVYHFIQAGIDVNEKTIPDISIGIGWAKHWKANNLEKKYGQSKSFPHIYPNDFPQSKSNPQPANCYPIEALGDYRKWLKYVYIDSGKLQQYLQGKIKSNHIPISVANQLIENLNKKPTEITDARR